MSTLFSATLLTIGAVLLWRSEWARNKRTQRRLKPLTPAEDFWIDFKPKPTGTPLQGRPIMDDADVRVVKVEYCDRCPGRATYLAFKDDLDLALCDHHTNGFVDGLVAMGFGLQLIPGVRTAVTSG